VYALFAYVPVQSEYRADGEMLLCYALLLLENVFMATFPFVVVPSMPVPDALLPPHSRFYAALCAAILSGSVIGSVFLSLYTCFLDTPYSTLSSSEGATPSCSSVCCPCCYRQRGSPQPPSSLEVSDDRKRRKRRRRMKFDSSYLSTQTGAGPPQRYSTLEECGTPPELTDSPPTTTVQLTNDPSAVQLMSPGSALGVDGRLVLTPDDGRPSILEGDDDSDPEVANESARTPLQPQKPFK
jgi:hypothetical protein